MRPALAVYDTMQAMSNEIETLNLGLTTGTMPSCLHAVWGSHITSLMQSHRGMTDGST